MGEFRKMLLMQQQAATQATAETVLRRVEDLLHQNARRRQRTNNLSPPMSATPSPSRQPAKMPDDFYARGPFEA